MRTGSVDCIPIPFYSSITSLQITPQYVVRALCWRAWFISGQELFHPRFVSCLFPFPSFVPCTSQFFPLADHPFEAFFILCTSQFSRGSRSIFAWKWCGSFVLFRVFNVWFFSDFPLSHPGTRQLVQARTFGFFGIQLDASIEDGHNGVPIRTFACVAAFGASRTSALPLFFDPSVYVGRVSTRSHARTHLVLFTSRCCSIFSLALDSSSRFVSSILSRRDVASATVMSTSCTVLAMSHLFESTTFVDLSNGSFPFPTRNFERLNRKETPTRLVETERSDGL